MPPVRLLPVLLALVVALGATACGAAPSPVSGMPGVDPAAAELLLANGQVPTGPTTSAAITVGSVREAPWALYLEVSRTVGRDFTAAQGRPATLLRTPVRGAEPDAMAFVLVVDGRVAGAWIGPGGTSSGVLPISGRP